MEVVLCSVIASMTLGTGYLIARKRRRTRRGPHDVLRQVFRPREYRELDGTLERVAVLELRRLEDTAKRYIAGEAGYVVGISGSRHGIGLGLSDGHRLELGGVSRSVLSLLVRGAAAERLRPAHVTRDGFSYRLLFRGEAGAEVEVFARRLTLAL
jgi:hypothetical protein